MRRIAWGLLACASVVCAAGTASAQNHWYIEGSAGAQLRDDVTRWASFRNILGTTTQGTNTTTYSPGIVANLGLGYKLPLGFRVEGEVGYAHYTASSDTPTANGGFPTLNGTRLTPQTGGGVDQITATANAFYDLPVSGGLIPYIGGGFGGSLTGTQGGLYTSPGGVSALNVGGSSGYVYPVILGEAGMAIAYSTAWAVVPSYRFAHVFNSVAPLQ
jgi:opacity protein-like surface antigen